MVRRDDHGIHSVVQRWQACLMACPRRKYHALMHSLVPVAEYSRFYRALLQKRPMFLDGLDSFVPLLKSPDQKSAS